MANYYRTHTCSELSPSLDGQTVTLSGWISTVRDHGGLSFLDLRDKSGICQVSWEQSDSVEGADSSFKGIKLKQEQVIRVTGKLIRRPEGMENKKVQNGDIELRCESIELLSDTAPLPFQIEENIDHVHENTRLKYRYLDLRRPELQRKLEMRHKAFQASREYFTQREFLEIETPILYKSTPEGARDYLVPSRNYPGQFYALPQSPQTLKQLLMISGFEKYFQICKCFRDEDLRADRQPEFTQIDIEASFVEENDIYQLLEGYMKHLWKRCLDVELETPFQRITYETAMNSYGSDKPDLRYGLALENISELVKDSGFRVFSSAVQNGASVIALPVRNSELKELGREVPNWSRKNLDGFVKYVEAFGLKGLAWIKVSEGEWSGPIAKFFDEEKRLEINKALKLEAGDVVMFGAEESPRILQAMGALRQSLAKKELDLENAQLKNPWAFAWITEFPLFEYSAKDKRLFAAHHPFTMPQNDEIETLFNSADPEKLSSMRAQAYDLALNGYELGSGSIRIHDQKLQKRMFECLQLSEEDISEKFGYFVEALNYGPPPHGGFAFGMDRLMMLICGTELIRDVIAFPKTTSASDLMAASPSQVSPEQLADLRINVIKET